LVLPGCVHSHHDRPAVPRCGSSTCDCLLN
jgi:hypothetical protein